MMAECAKPLSVKSLYLFLAFSSHGFPALDGQNRRRMRIIILPGGTKSKGDKATIAPISMTHDEFLLRAIIARSRSSAP